MNEPFLVPFCGISRGSSKVLFEEDYLGSLVLSFLESEEFIGLMPPILVRINMGEKF